MLMSTSGKTSDQKEKKTAELHQKEGKTCQLQKFL